jgi:adhesin/invasin
MSAALLGLSCGGGVGPEDVAEIRVSAGNGQTADAGTDVPTRPAVLAVAEGGEPIPGVAIAFAVADGGGTVSPATATTDGDGIATTRWTLGAQPGDNVLTASTERLTTQLTFTATGVVGAAAIVQERSGDGQTATAGRPVSQRLSVTVTDQAGNAVAGVAVTWAVSGSWDRTRARTPLRQPWTVQRRRRSRPRASRGRLG